MLRYYVTMMAYIFISLHALGCEDRDSSQMSAQSADDMTVDTPEVTPETMAGVDDVDTAAGDDENIAGADGGESDMSGESMGGEEDITEAGENAGTEDPSPTDVDRPNLPQGRDDEFARRACQVLDLDVTPLIATGERSNAGQVAVLPSEMSAYQIRLPESGVGYITLEVPDWAITVGLFTHFTQRASVDRSSGNVDVVGPLSWNASCDEITDERLHFHSWGSYTVELSGEPNSDISLVLLKRQ